MYKTISRSDVDLKTARPPPATGGWGADNHRGIKMPDLMK